MDTSNYFVGIVNITLREQSMEIIIKYPLKYDRITIKLFLLKTLKYRI